MELEKVAFFARWLEAVSVGYELEQINILPDTALTNKSALRAVNAIERIIDLGQFLSGTYPESLFLHLPLVTIQHIAKLKHPDLVPLCSAAIKAREKILQTQNDGSFLVLKAKLVLDRLVSSTHTPLQAIGLLKAELGISVKKEAKNLEALAVFMREASRPNPKLLLQVTALENIGTLIGRTNGHWRLLENCFLQASFSWPLFVIDSGQDNDNQVVGTSLPFMVELKVPDSVPKLIKGQKVAIIGHSDAEFSANLRASAETALSAAIGAWKNQNSDWFLDFHERLDNADGVIDIRYAQKVRSLAGFDTLSPISGRSLRSLEAHLALKFYSALTDERGMDFSCATGALKPRRGYVDKSDFVIGNASGIIGKLERATLAASFDRICVPDKKESMKLVRVNVPPNLSIVRGEYFSDFAKAVFPTEFSRNKFIRCPDIAHAWDGAHPCFSADTSEVNEVRQAIHSATGTILVLDRQHKAAAVARALYLDNFKLKENAVALRTSSGHHSLVRNEDFLQSFVFIRAVEYETNERFWRVIWELLSGRDMEWEKFCFSVSNDIPAEMLAQLLNRNYSTKARPRRVPDKIVIIGSNRLNRDSPCCPTGPFARLQMQAILPVLQKHLRQIKPSYITERLGLARIILVPEDVAKSAGVVDVADIPKDMRSSVSKLAAFEYGFSFAVAKSKLGMDDWDAKQEILSMQSFEIGGVPLLSEIRGTTFAFNFSINQEPVTLVQKAGEHLKSARSLLGLAGGSVDMGHADFRRSLSAVAVHEAEFHLAGAARALKADPKGDSQLWNSIRKLRLRINRLAEPFSWTRVRFAGLQKGDDDESLVEVGLEHVRDWKGPIHPIELMLLIRMIWSFLRTVKDDPAQAKKSAELREKIQALVEQANVQSVRLPDEKESAACGFFVASGYVALSMWDDPTSENFKRLTHQIQVADSLSGAMIEVLDLSWFVLRGDNENYHEDALRYYHNGYFDDKLDGLVERRSIETLVKFLGANELFLGASEFNRISAETEWKLAVYGLRTRQIAYLILNRTPRLGIVDSDQAIARWKAGRLIAAKWLSDRSEAEGDAEVEINIKLERYRAGALVLSRLLDAPQEKWGDGSWRCLIKYLELSRAMGILFDTEIISMMNGLSALGKDALVRNLATYNR